MTECSRRGYETVDEAECECIVCQDYREEFLN